MTKKPNTYEEAIIIYKKLVVKDKHQDIVALLRPFLKSKFLDAEKKLRLKTVLAVSLNKLFKHHESVLLLKNNELENYTYATLIQYYFTLVDTYYFLLDTENAYRYVIQAMRLAKKENDIDQIGVAYNYLGSIYHMMDDNRNAVIQFTKCVRIYKSNNSIENSSYKIATSYNNIGNCLIALNKITWAKKFIKQSLVLNKKQLQSANLYIQSYLYQTNIFIQLKEFKNAEKSLRDTKSIFNDKNDLEKIFDITLYEFKLLFLQQKKSHNQIQLLQILEKLSSKIIPSNKLLIYYETISNYYLYEEDFKNAFLYKEKYTSLVQQLNRTATFNKIKQLQLQYELENIQLEKNSIEQIAKAKQDFLMEISHEIRSPLNIIIGALELIDKNEQDLTQLQYIDIAQKGATSLFGLINDVLDNAKIESGKFAIIHEPVNIHKLITDIKNLYTLEATHKQIKLNVKIDFSEDFWIVSDQKRLQQILVNLIANALKYTTKGKILIYARINKYSKLLIDVTDSGNGIKKEDTKYLFKAYSQIDIKNKQLVSSTGLGLAISKKLCVLMNGDLSLFKSDEKGSVFRVELPVVKTKSKLPEKIYKTPRIYKKIKIIIADDIVENRIIIKDLLHKNNSDLKICEAENGADLLLSVAAKPYDLIIIDLDMPIMNGFQFIEKFRIKNKSTKVLAMTASLLSLQKSELIALGFDDLILKPFKPKDLINKIVCLVN